MLSAILLISTLLALPVLVASILSQAALWQRKEYRPDRLLAALLSPELEQSLFTYAAALTLSLAGWISLTEFNLQQANIIGFLTLVLLIIFYSARASHRGIFRPQPTLKSILILLTTTLLTVAYLKHSAFPHLSPPLHWATVLLLTPAFTTLSVYLVNLATDWRRHQIIKRAARLRASLSRLVVVGITGSYGKTSTKHFLSQLLPAAIVSKEHRNSPLPLAQDMLEQLTPDSHTYIVELGAYRRGEIKHLAQITQPRLGVITAIGNQHLATFGSPEKILQTKWELIESLPPDGIAILNADDEELQRQRVLPECRTIYYSTKHPADVYVDGIDIKARSISCRLHLKDSSFPVTIPLAGAAALANVIAAVAAAHALGASPEQILNRLEQLKPYPQTMEVLGGQGGSTIIDDSYSANEAGVLSAIKHLEHFTQPDKRIVLVPLIELGQQAKAVHRRIGKALAESGANVYLYGRAYQKELTSSLKSKDKPYVTTRPADLVNRVSKDLTPKTLILLEGRVPEIIRQTLLPNYHLPITSPYDV